MPCIYEPTAEEIKESENIKIRPYLQKINKLTRMLCELCKAVERDWAPIECVPAISIEITQWWEKHKQDDKAKQEKIKQQALSKLTHEEREALGL